MPEPLALFAFYALPVLSVAASLAYWLRWTTAEATSLTGALTKAASTGTMALWGATAGAPSYAILGLALGSVGDFCLARRGERAFLSGMAAFALGHLAYALGLLLQGSAFESSAPTFGRAVAALGLAVVVLSTEVWLAPRTGALRWPVRGYVLVIGLMGLAALALPAHPGNTSAAMIRLGAALFILSDVLLALRLFVMRSGPGARGLSLTLWPAYWAGQMLILVGTRLYGMPVPA